MSAQTVVGCLLDVSGSMKEALEAGRAEEGAVERLRAVLQAALKLAQAEQRHNPNSLVFVGAFGLNRETDCPPCIDLCGLLDALLDDNGDNRTGHDRLIALARQHDVSHVTRYIRTKLTDEQAGIVYAYLRKHPERIREFLTALPSGVGAFAGGVAGAFFPSVENYAVENSEALRLARSICSDWWRDFSHLAPRPVADVVNILQRLQDQSTSRGSRTSQESAPNKLLDSLRRYIYWDTPMCDALSRSLATYRQHNRADRRVLVIVSDGYSTDGDPLPLARQLQQANVTIATVYLTASQDAARRQLYDRGEPGWNAGQRKLFDMATRVAGATHPIPVLASIGWAVPSSGECALHATVSSAAALDEFCSLLLSARFGSADTLLDVLGRVSLDEYINDAHVRTCNHPLDQGQSATCYAHAAAAVLHMALLRIEGRIGGCPSIETIRSRILREFPPAPGGRPSVRVLEAAAGWYRPLRFKEVDEDGARQAVLRRRPVLATFRLSNPGWAVFSQHFAHAATQQQVLTCAAMRPYHSLPDGGGHAVVLTGCDPKSLTFLNSWGYDWGNNGSFSIEDHGVLEHMRFYDVFWVEGDLAAAERQAYQDKVDREFRDRAAQHPSVFELEARCPRCRVNSPIADFTGSIRQAKCPRCRLSFAPEPGHLVQALYARAGLGDVAG